MPFELYPDVYIGRQATEYLRTYDHNQPWFCWVGFPGPHEPWDAPEPYGSKYSPDSMPLPTPRMKRLNPEPTGFLDDRLAQQIPFEEGDVANMRANYAGSVSLIDDQIAAILRVVEERGELDRTVIAFSSDHGEMNGDHGIIYKKAFLNGAARIPLLVRVPGDGFAQGTVSSSLVELMDLGATLAQLGGARDSNRSRARSLVGVLEDPEREHRPVVVSGLKKEIMAASTDWKIVLDREGHPYALFDLRNDPDESTNVFGDPNYDATVDQLQKELRKTHPGLFKKLAAFKRKIK